MEDEHMKDDQPSTSKKESRRPSGHDLYDDRDQDDRGTSESSVSADYSVRSRIEMAEARPEVPKLPPVKREREPKASVRKKRGRRGVGRVEKRRRSFTRRQVRRAPRRKPRAPVKAERKEREQSVSTIFTRLSSRSGSKVLGCIHCGHRCCRRSQSEGFVDKHCQKGKRRKPKRYQRMKKKILRGCIKKKRLLKHLPRISERTQVGSRSLMLSPLLINTGSDPNPAEEAEASGYIEVTPEMIYEGLRRLTVWRQSVMTSYLMQYIMRNYPVNQNEVELYEELKEKLRIAAIVGIVEEAYDDYWCISCALQKRSLNPNHVTLFWHAYGDTLSAIQKEKPEVIEKVRHNQSTSAKYKGKSENFPDDLI